MNDEIKSNGTTLSKELKRFYKSYYSSHIMTIAIQTPEKINTLEHWAKKYFGKIPMNPNLVNSKLICPHIYGFL